MKKKIEKNLSQAISKMIPENMFEKVYSNLSPVQEERTMIMSANIKPKKTFRLNWAILASAFLIFTLCAISIPYYTFNYAVDSIIDIDVNPSVELTVNKKDKVLNVVAVNEDGRKILEGMDLKNADMKVAINAIIGSMVQNGYIINDKNGILVSVHNDNTDKAQKLRDNVITDINESLTSNNVTASVFNQTIDNSTDAKEFAKANNISVGKACFILNLIAKDSLLDPVELAKMNMKQLASLIAEKNLDISDVVDYDDKDSLLENIEDAIDDDEDEDEDDIDDVDDQDEDDNDKDENEDDDEDDEKDLEDEDEELANAVCNISVAKAKEIALNHAGILSEGVDFFKAKLGKNNNAICYELEFCNKDAEFEYEIDANSGKVLYSFKEEDAKEDTEEDTQGNGQSQGEQSGAQATLITTKKAKELALAHAGLTQSGTTFEKSVLSKDNDTQIYELDFSTADTEYSYIINASTGEILESDSEPIE